MDRSILNLSNILEPATLKNIHDADLNEKRKAVETIWAYYQVSFFVTYFSILMLNFNTITLF